MSNVKRYWGDSIGLDADCFPVVSACDYDALAAERDEWRKQASIGVHSQFDEGRRYEARIAELEAALRDHLSAINLYGAPRCAFLNHSRWSYHAPHDPCPVEAQIRHLLKVDAQGMPIKTSAQGDQS